jgi:N-acetylmuramoyl-L-alanine amidase
MKMKVCIDAGHGGIDSGAVGVNGRMEKDDNLRMAQALKREMERRGHFAIGHSIIMTRTDDSFPSLNERANFANREKADVFISLHRNFHNGGGNGGEVLYGRNASKKSIVLAEAINARMNEAAGFKNRGAKRQGAIVLERTKMPAVTVEAGFITSEIDNAKFDNHFDDIIRAIVDACISVFNLVADPYEDDPYAYVTVDSASLWLNVGRVLNDTVVTLDAYEEGDQYARVKDKAGKEYLVKWSQIKKA